MGNTLKGNKGGFVQTPPQQGGMYVPYQQQQQQQPQFVQQPQYVKQPVIQQQQQPQFAPQQPPQYRPPMYPPQQPSYPSAPYMPRYPVPPPLPLANDRNPASYYENDAFLSNLTGWSIQDIERLRHEFLSYANSYGVIDREGFRKLYIASLLNMTWEALERDAESAFRNFDINQTGFLDFNEYVTACTRLARETAPSPSYNY